MQQDNLTARGLERLVLKRNYGGAWSDRIVLSGRGKSLLVDFARPEVSGDCKQVRVAKNWPELGQTPDYCTRSLFLLRSSERIMASANSRMGRRSRRLSFRKRR